MLSPLPTVYSWNSGFMWLGISDAKNSHILFLNIFGPIELAAKRPELGLFDSF